VTNGSSGLDSRRAWRRSSAIFDDAAAVEARGAAAMRFPRVALVNAIVLRRRRLRTGASSLAGDWALSSAEVCEVRRPLTNTIARGLTTVPAREPQSSPRANAAGLITTRQLRKCPPAALAGPSLVTLGRRDFARPAQHQSGEHLRKIKDDQYIQRNRARVGLVYNETTD